MATINPIKLQEQIHGPEYAPSQIEPENRFISKALKFYDEYKMPLIGMTALASLVLVGRAYQAITSNNEHTTKLEDDSRVYSQRVHLDNHISLANAIFELRDEAIRNAEGDQKFAKQVGNWINYLNGRLDNPNVQLFGKYTCPKSGSGLCYDDMRSSRDSDIGHIDTSSVINYGIQRIRDGSIEDFSSDQQRDFCDFASNYYLNVPAEPSRNSMVEGFCNSH